MYNRGAYFLSDVLDNNGYSLPTIRTLDMDSLLILYRRDFEEDFLLEFYEERSKGRRRKAVGFVASAGTSSTASAEASDEAEESIMEIAQEKRSATRRAAMAQLEDDDFQSAEAGNQSGNDMDELSGAWRGFHRLCCHTDVTIFYFQYLLLTYTLVCREI